jgi:hypothetical protein
MICFRLRTLLIAVAVLTVAILWVLTATWGVSDVAATLERDSQGLNQSLASLTRLDFDPVEAPGDGAMKMPWYFIGRTSSPFPLIVAVDHAYAVAPAAGQRSRYYVLWLFGFQIPIYQHVAWIS